MVDRSIYLERLNKLSQALEKAGLDALLLNRAHNIAYLTGAVNSCSWVFVTRKGKQVALVLDSDASVYGEETVIRDLRTFRMHDPFSLFRRVIKELKLTRGRLGVELSRPGLPVNTLEMVKHAFPETIQFVNGERLVEEMRAIQSNEEIKNIEKAARIAETGMRTAISFIRPGMQERDVLTEAEYAMRKEGGGISTLNYLGSGKRSCIAHHTPSEKKIEAGEVVTLDIHGAFRGYSADLARTVVCGRITRDIRRAYGQLLKAQEESIASCRGETPLRLVARTFYRGLSGTKPFKFLMGPVLHGVGIMNFEMPYFEHPFQEKGYPERLSSDMVIALTNIGLYSAKGWAVRLEDTIRITDRDPVALTRFPKELVAL